MRIPQDLGYTYAVQLLVDNCEEDALEVLVAFGYHWEHFPNAELLLDNIVCNIVLAELAKLYEIWAFSVVLVDEED